MAKTPQPVKLTSIYLDLDNPRHKPLGSQMDAIHHLIEHEDVRPLAKHIAQVGSTSPLDLMALVPHPTVKGGYITAEGNRRLCALKLLLDPDKAASDKDKRYFRSLQQSMGTPIKELLTVVFPDMETARPWVELRHEGPQGGIGTKQWDSQQKARFNLQGKADNPNALALTAMDYARSHALLPAKDLDKLSITTLTRFLGTPDLRSALGIADSRELLINVPADEFKRALTKFLSDSLAEKSPVSSRANAKDRKDYAEGLRTGGFSPTTRGLPPSAPGSQATAAQTAAAKSGSQASTTRDNQHPDKRKYIIPSSFGVRIRDKTLKHLYDELKNIEAPKFSFCAVYLLRSVLEKSTTLYLKGKKIAPKKDLHEKISQLAEQLATEGMADRELKILRTMSKNGRDDPNSPDTLGHYIHGGAIPHKTYAFRYWDNIEHIMQRVLNTV